MPALSYSELNDVKVLPDIKTTGTEGNIAKYVSNQVGGKKSRKTQKSRKSKGGRKSRKSQKSRKSRK